MSEQPDRELQEIRQAARKVIEEGAGIRDQIRRITIDALKVGHLEAQRIKSVVEAVTAGAVDTVQSNVETSKDSIKEALSGIDDALATAARATQVTVAEAQQRVQQFTEQDLAKAKSDLMALESLFMDTISQLADRSGEAGKQWLADLQRQAKETGTAVGKQITSTVSDTARELKSAGEAHVNKTLDAALSSGSKLAQAASGVLASLADSLSSSKPDKKQDPQEG